MPRLKFRERVEQYFKARSGQWIDGKDLEAIGGRYAWRSRVSDCRTQRGMTIENRLRHIQQDDGTRFTVSEYRYVPPVPREIDLSAVREQRLF